MAFRDFRHHPGKKFSELLRKVKRGEPETKQPTRMAAAEKGEPEPERHNPRSEPMAKKHGGKYHRIEIVPEHTIVDGKRQVTHVVHVHHHRPKAKANEPMPYREPTRHMHTNLEEAKKHVASLMDGLEPEEKEPDTQAMGSAIY